jgi:Leucine-rich repeat (LRR) protein
MVWATRVSSLDFARDAALIAMASAHDAVVRAYDSRFSTRASATNQDLAGRETSRESNPAPERSDLAARGGTAAGPTQNEVTPRAERLDGSAPDFDSRDLLFLQDLIDRNGLTESSSSFDSDNGNGILEPRELGHQVWRATRLVEFRSGPDPYGSFGYAIRELPESVANLDRLEVLDLNSNSLTVLPEAVGTLRNLRELRLFRNRLSQLPKGVGGLLDLRVLVLSGNEVPALPESIADLGQLEALYLRDNPLAELPADLAKLDHLQILDLTRSDAPQTRETAGSGFTRLPIALAQLSRLQELHLGGNSLYCASGVPTPEAVPSFLRDGSIPHVYGLLVQACP